MLPPQRAVRIAWTLAIAGLIAYSAAVSVGRTTHGFIAYYGAARLFVAGELSEAAYDDLWFNGYVQRITNTGVREIFTPNPPPMALLAVPLTSLQPLDARAVWLLASILAYAAAIALLLRNAPIRRTEWLPFLVFLLLVNPPVLANLRLGQAYLLIAALYALLAIAMLHDRQSLAGALLGLLFAVKATGAPLFLLLAVGRRWRALTTSLVAMGAVFALTATRVDPGMWPAYPNAVLETLSRPTISVTASQSTLSLARRLCVPDLEWNPHGPARCPTAAKIVPGVLILIVLAVTAWISREVPMQTWLSAGIVLSVLSGPMAEDYHFAVLAVPIVLLLSASAPNVAALGVMALLIFLPLRLTAFRFQDGWWSVLAYPRLYAAWLLWAVHAFGVRKHFRRLRGGAAAEPRFN